VKRFVAVSGNIGSGKSTVTTLLSEKLGWTPYYEVVDENPYLADFYGDMSRGSCTRSLGLAGSRRRGAPQAGIVMMGVGGGMVQNGGLTVLSAWWDDRQYYGGRVFESLEPGLRWFIEHVFGRP
jgi:deoxynucleoside kinase